MSILKIDRQSKDNEQLIWRGHNLGRLTLGTAQLGMDYGIANQQGRPSLSIAKRIVKKGLDVGITMFDTAQGYQDSEAVLGTALKSAGVSDQVHVVTKLAPELERAGANDICMAIERSRAKFDISSFFCVLYHREECLSNPSSYRSIFKSLKRKGLTKYTGISVYGTDAVELALEAPEIDIIQVPFNVLDQRALKLGWFDKALAAGKLLFVRSVFLQGLLLLEPNSLPDHMAFAHSALVNFRSATVAASLSIKEACIGFVWTAANGAAIIFGAENPEQVAETARLATSYKSRTFPKDVFADLDECVEPELINPSLWPRGEGK